MREPAGSTAEQGDQQAGGNALRGPARQMRGAVTRHFETLGRSGQRPQAFRQRFVEHRIEQFPQARLLRQVGTQAFGVLGLRREVLLDVAAPRFGQDRIDASVQFGFADHWLAHRTILNWAAGGRPCMIMRSRSRPRARRDMTVPIGMPTVAAISA